ncbi:MAG: YihA family ribosome biogenesis GTP-binding protein [Chitinophagaceae bacterium]|nr:YihA family ribosome biogenesis GTP-binding protein [Chitinophagaceae bacterium]
MVIISAAYLISSPGYQQCPKPDRPEYAFIGRSNVGKSSLINMLCNNQKLAKTSGIPGKTQMINHFDVVSETADGRKTKWYMVDLPGYGFAKVSQQQRRSWTKMLEEYLRKRENLVSVFVLIDGRHGPQKADKEFINRLGEWQVPFCLVFTKSDKATQQDISKNVQSFLKGMQKDWQELPEHFITSAVKKTGKDKILAAIDKWNDVFEERSK